ncbi:MAG: methyltransferase domain-containing protein [Paracoccaceae bacterium]
MTDFVAARKAMVDCQVRPSDVTSYPIIAAMLAVPREEFVPRAARETAYLGAHIPLAPGRVLLDARSFGKMLEALNIQPTEMVLDIGCGLGYSTALLARLAEFVVGVEADEAMAAEAEAILAAQSADNAVVVAGELAAGAAAHAPYDVIVLQGAYETMPQALVDQLKLGGRIAAIHAEGAYGTCRIGIKTSAGVSWRRAFDAAAPVLPGFAAAPAFVF